MLVLSQNCIFEHMTDKFFLVTAHPHLWISLVLTGSQSGDSRTAPYLNVLCEFSKKEGDRYMNFGQLNQFCQ